MRAVATIVMVAVLVCPPVLAQTSLPNQSATSAKAPGLGERMAPLQSLVGPWVGHGWMLLPDGKRETFSSNEIITPRLSGAALLVEGQHRSASDNRIVHDAMAMIVWDSRQNGYRIRTQLASGMGGDFPLTVTPKGFAWSMASPAGQIDYVAEIVNNSWIERGTLTARDGKKLPFFEMTLRRQ